MRKAISKFLFYTLMGFRHDDPYPVEAKRAMIVAMPHTSNWDFLLGIFTRPIMEVDTYFAAKHSLFWFPLGVILRWWGGVPVDRSKKTNFVDAVAALYEGKESYKITIAPEGTRQKVTKLKTGFYYIAIKANVPIVCCKFDWGNRVVGFSQPFYPTGDYDKDLPHILAYFKGIKGKNEGWEFDIPS